jgi:hypothetical protein
MKRSVPLSTIGGLFVVSLAVGWLTNQPREAQGGKLSKIDKVAPRQQIAKQGKAEQPGAGNNRHSNETKNSVQSKPAVWVAVSSDLVNPQKNVRGSGLRLDIRDSIQPGSMSSEAWGAAPENKNELAALQSLLLKTRSSLAALAPEPELTGSDANSVKYRIGVFDGGRIKEMFLSEISDLMGEERAAILLASSRPVLDFWLFSFGENPVEFSFDRAGGQEPKLVMQSGQSLFGSKALAFWSQAYPGLARSYEAAKHTFESTVNP